MFKLLKEIRKIKEIEKTLQELKDKTRENSAGIEVHKSFFVAKIKTLEAVVQELSQGMESINKRLEALEKKQHISGDKVKRLSRKVNKRKKK